MQWRGFQSLRGQEIPRILSNDLTELERWLKQLSDRVAGLLSEEPISGGGATSNAAAKVNEPYITALASTDLTQERVLTQGTGITVTDSGPNSTITVAIDSTVITGAGVATRGTFWTGTNTIGSAAEYYWDNVNKRLGINVATAPSARIHSIDTTEPLRLGYDTSNYAEFQVSSAGILTIDANPSSGQGKIRIQDDLLGINVAPADAWIKVQNQGSDPEAEIAALTPWAWWAADSMTSAGVSSHSHGDNLGAGAVTWFDRSLNSRTLTLDDETVGGSGVTFSRTGSAPEIDAVVFTDGNRGRGDIAGSPHTLTTYTIYAVYLQPGAGTSGVLLGGSAGIGGGGFGVEFIHPPFDPTTTATDDNWRVKSGTNEPPVPLGYVPGTNDSWTTTSYNIHVLKRSAQIAGGSEGLGQIPYTSYRNGTTIGTINFSIQLPGETFTLNFDTFRNKWTGSDWSSLSGMTFAEVIIFSTAHDDTTRATVESYLNNKYALNGGTAPADTFDFDRRLNTSGNLLYRIDPTAQVLSSDIAYTTALTSRLTLIDAGGDMFDMGINIAGPYLSHWELTTLTGNRTVTIPNDGGTILLYTPTSLANNDLVQYNGTTWVNKTLAGAGVASSGITLTAGAGLTGGGDLSANRTFDVGAGTGITVNANDVQISPIAAESFFANNTASSAVPVAVAGTTVAGAGLTYTTGGILAVGAGLGLTSNANDIQITLGLANRVLGINNAANNVEYKDILGTANEISVTHAANSITLAFADHPILATKGGTGIASYAIGDLLYANTTTTLAKLADVAVGSVLASGGTNTAPLWKTLATAGIAAGSGTGKTIPRWSGAGASTTLEDSVSITNDDNGVFITPPGGGDYSTGGQASFYSGVGGSGSISFYAAPALIGTGGAFTMAAGSGGSATVDANGGLYQLTAGDAGNGGTGGNFVLEAGDGGYANGGAGGNASMRAGQAISGNNNGGNVNLRLGAKNGSGTDGYLGISIGTTGFQARVQTSLLTANRAIQFPDAAGTFALAATTLAGYGITSPLPIAEGGTGLSSWTQGDIPYFTSGTALSKLARSASATRYLSNQGTSNAPSWNQVNLADGVTGTLVAANMGALTGEVTSSAGSFATAITRSTAFTWTGTHTFSLETVHNGGIQVGTASSVSGRFDSITNDAAGLASFLFQPTTALTATASPNERYLFRINDSTAAAAFIVWPDNRITIGGTTGATSATGLALINVLDTTTLSGGIYFAPTSSSGAGANNLLTAAGLFGGYFAATPAASSVVTSSVGGAFVGMGTGNTAMTNDIAYAGIVARATNSSTGATNTGRTWTFYGAKFAKPTLPAISNTRGTVGNLYGTYVEAATGGYTNAVTNEYGHYVEEQAKGATIKNGIFLANATSGYKAIAIRDQDAWIGSDAAATLTIGGTNLGVKTTNLGFYSVTPVARPSAYTQTYSTADKTHANLTAATLTDSSGGTANTTVQALTNPVDTPITADALRDDLVTNLIPELRNNFADLTAQHNALLADLTDLKQLANSMIDDLQALGLYQ